MAMTPLPESRLVLHSEFAELNRLAGWIEGWTQRHALSPDQSFAIALCLEEAVANVIMYGGTGDHPLVISVEAEHNGGTSIVRIEDNGRQFDPTQVPSPPMAASLQEAKIGNVGVHLMRSFASGMHYERRNGHNRLTLRFGESKMPSSRSDPRQ
jgi:anti-sigma regulatory factor (Ser/Thr protein kinase)